MASFVQATTGFNSSGSNNNLFTSNFGSACTAGNALLVGICMDVASGTVSLSDNATPHNTYNLLASYTASSLTILLYAALNITANSGAVYQVQATENGATTFIDGQIFAQEWSGFATSGSILDVSRTDTGSTANPTNSGTLTTTQTNELILSILMLQSQTNTYSAGTGYSNLSNAASSFTSGGMESKALAAAGGTTAGFGMTNTGVTYIQLTAGLKTTASAGSFIAKANAPILQAVNRASRY